MNNPFVSVIIPVFNDKDRLILCLQALEKQNYSKDKYEVIVVDNGSTDNVQSIVKQFNQAKLAFEKKTGSYAARNKGISVAKGILLAFTDSDCIPCEDWLKNGVYHITQNSKCGLVAGKIKIFPQTNGYPTLIELYDISTGFQQECYLKERHFSVTANLITSKRVVKQVGLFNPLLKSGGDLDFGLRIHKAGYEQIYADKVIVMHPARHTFSQLFNQAIRVAGGRYQLAKESHNTKHKKQYFTHFSTISNSLIKIWALPQLSVITRFGLIGIGFSLRFISTWAHLRLLLGGKAVR